jgi:hypothetical protein
MSSESRVEPDRDASRNAEGKSRSQGQPQASEPVTQVIGDRYMDPDQLKSLLEKKFPGSYKMQVSQAALTSVALTRKLLSTARTDETGEMDSFCPKEADRCKLMDHT